MICHLNFRIGNKTHFGCVIEIDRIPPIGTHILFGESLNEWVKAEADNETIYALIQSIENVNLLHKLNELESWIRDRYLDDKTKLPNGEFKVDYLIGLCYQKEDKIILENLSTCKYCKVIDVYEEIDLGGYYNDKDRREVFIITMGKDEEWYEQHK